ncbi:MAG TPA: 1,4-alpha-glucan branching protein GlgB [Gammaproteobacteria bacterium]
MNDSPNTTNTPASASRSATAVRPVTTNPSNPDGVQHLDPELQKIINAQHHDPFSILGIHRMGSTDIVRAFIPRAQKVQLPEINATLQRIPNTDLFEWRGEANQLKSPYQMQWIDDAGKEHRTHDPYSFLAQLSDFDLHLFSEGKHWHAYRILGAHYHAADGVNGILFATWAPNAERVSVIGNFNHWDGRCHPMRCRGGTGVWELFIPGLAADELYKFEIRGRNGRLLEKTDPYGQAFECRPKTASIVTGNTLYHWQDHDWIERRKTNDWLHTPLSIYEVHLGSWQRDDNGNFLSYKELAHRLVKHVQALGFTHLQLLPITEHPFDGSWGYQTTGYFAPTSRFGSPDEFRYFIDYCHRNNIGVLLDWAPGHFPKDAHALAEFDGTPLYEHADPRQGEHRDWGTLIYNYGRNEVKNFLLSSALFWLQEMHIDGLRVDAVASILYLDYSRQAGDWLPNIYGGNENLEAIDFLRELNTVVHGEFPGCLMIAEESTAWPQVTRPTWLGGLGFSMKWNMGWMHDTLTYFSKDPVHRHYHHDQLTFGLLYAFTENFVLPLSHDEVVHGKNSLLNKMPGDEWQRFANLRLLYTYMFTYPGKKILFMGGEFGQGTEWNHSAAMDWYVLQYPQHQGVMKLMADLNKLYCQREEFYRHDFEPEGFEWIDCHDASQSIISYQRKVKDKFLIVVLNFTPVPRHNYRIGVPRDGAYHEILNSDSEYYGGGNVGSGHDLAAEPVPWMNQAYSLNITLPPLAGVVIERNAPR